METRNREMVIPIVMISVKIYWNFVLKNIITRFLFKNKKTLKNFYICG